LLEINLKRESIERRQPRASVSRVPSRDSKGSTARHRLAGGEDNAIIVIIASASARWLRHAAAWLPLPPPPPPL
jgi:hypothetical protein